MQPKRGKRRLTLNETVVRIQEDPPEDRLLNVSSMPTPTRLGKISTKTKEGYGLQTFIDQYRLFEVFISSRFMRLTFAPHFGHFGDRLGLGPVGVLAVMVQYG
jgi:hypothetical protein